jgi:hypothetical protein
MILQSHRSLAAGPLYGTSGICVSKVDAMLREGTSLSVPPQRINYLRVHLINPSDTAFGTAVITPRWLFVLAAATPEEFGDPILCDETLEALDVDTVASGDIVGIGIHTGNALRGYAIGGSVAPSIWLCGEHVAPNVPREHSEAIRNTILALLQLLYKFDSREHDPGVLERFEAQHG